MSPFRRMLALILCAVLPQVAIGADTPPIPLATFFKKSVTTGATLSPNGRFVALRKLSPSGRTMLTVVDVAACTPRAIVNFRNADVDSFSWLNDERLTYTLINVDHDGEAGKPGLYAINRDGKERTFLWSTIVRKRSFSESDMVDHNYQSDTYVHGFRPADGESILVLANYPTGEKKVARLNTRNAGAFPLTAPSGTYGWLLDARGALRIAVAKRNKRVVTFYIDEDNWREIDNRDEGAEASFDPLLYVDDQLYVSARNGNDEKSVHRYDLAKNAIDPQPLIGAPGFDTDGTFILSDKEMLGFRFTAESETTVWFDDRMKAIQKEIDQLLPGMVNRISRGRASEMPYVLIDNYSDVENHAYVLYNTETKQQILLGETTPDIPADRMAHTSMVRYKARDGLPIPAFLTLPNGADRKKLPTVVLVGPQPDRRGGGWEWNAEVQFLASRGYAVLQPQPRGVAGFGRTHLRAGINQAGRAAQDDIADAVKGAVAAGHADPARVCIAGTGYGGYAAMMGLLRDADTFTCGISWSGLTTYQNNPDDGKLKDIKRPVLLAYGTDDEAVDYKQALAFYQTLKGGNPQAEWLEYTSTVDDWKTQKNRIDLWRHIESFLARQIGAK